MGGLEDRLKRLEARSGESVEDSDWYQRYLWMQLYYFSVLENARREMEGLEPLPVPEEEPDPELDAEVEAYFEELERQRTGGEHRG